MCSITLHFALCLEVSMKPRYHINKMAERFWEQTRDPQVKKTMRYIIKNLPNNVEIVSHYVKLHEEKGLFKTN